MRIVDVIARKRDGFPLTPEQLDHFVEGVTTGIWADYQASALLMAIVLRGMTAEETAALTDSMLRSGQRLDLSDIPGVKVGKHSTGGVGDKVSIALAPVAAACGLIVPKMSGRGLGHTGGTLDKLESIPGFRTDLSIDEFKQTLREVGVSIIGQTATLVPADRWLYGLRDVTATVESIPLVAASIMSKKMAEGSSALVLDVKCGSGAVMKHLEGARELAACMVTIGTRAGLATEAVITDMDVPLGRAVGNALEIIECLEMLKGNGPDDLSEVMHRLAAHMLRLGGVAADDGAARRAVSAALESGAALTRLQRMIERQGGDPRVVDDYSRLPSVSGTAMLTADRSGYVAGIRADFIGRASIQLGSGRNRVKDTVDHAVGIIMHTARGRQVAAGDALVELRHRDGRGVSEAMALCGRAVAIADQPPAPAAKILGEVR